jgi:myosin-5
VIFLPGPAAVFVITMAHNYEVGTRAWQPDATEGWVASEVKEKLVDGDKVRLVFVLENGEVCSCSS